ncbi:unnamed protein product, partial [marine sediment metagenome]
IYSEVMATYIGAAVVDTVMTGSPYTPLKDGRLVQLKLVVYGSAATALIEGVVVTVTSPLWGVPVTVATSGGGLRTAPTLPIPTGIQNCDVPVKTGTKIACEFRNVTADTPVTVEATLIGVFEG